MRELPLPITSQEWMRQMFATKTALDGGVIRRKVSDVERLVGRDAFLIAMKSVGFAWPKMQDISWSSAIRMMSCSASDPLDPNFLSKKFVKILT